MGLVPRLDSFCCACSLKHGTLIVLIIPLICVTLAPFVDKIDLGNQSLILTTVSYILCAAACVTGLYGVFKQKRAFLIPFLVLDFWIVFGGLIFCVTSFTHHIGKSLLVLLFIPFYGYSFLVVFSYFCEMGDDKTTAPTTAA